jgi:hypothetical protein
MSATPHRHGTRAAAVLRALWLAVVVAVGLPALVSAFAQPPAFGRERAAAAPLRDVDDARDREERYAESAAVVARLRARFRETLDFAPLMDEFFVADVGRRNASARGESSYLKVFGATDELCSSLDEAELRRGYVAFLNILFLGEASLLANMPPEPDDPEIPPSVAREMLSSTYFRVLVTDGDEADLPRLATHDDFLRWAEDAEAIAAAYRRVVTPATFDDPIYLENRAKLDTRAQILAARSDADSGYIKFGVPEGDTVYEVYRLGVWYSLVEENGELKVLTIAVGDD